MKRLLVYLLALGTITGLIPILLLAIMEKSIIFTILVGIIVIVGLFKMLCY